MKVRKEFNFEDFSKKAAEDAGMLTSLTDEDANKYPMESLDGKIGDAITAINYIPNERGVVLAIIWKCSSVTILNEAQMAKEEEIAAMIVAKGCMVKNWKIGDIVEVSKNVTKQQIGVLNNKISIKRQIDKFNLTGSKNVIEIYSVEYFSIPTHGIEGIYLD